MVLVLKANSLGALDSFDKVMDDCRMMKWFLVILAVAWLAATPANSQDFLFYLPEEEVPAEEPPSDAQEVLVVEEIAPVDGFFARLLKVLRGVRVENAEGQPAPDAFANGVVSTDPNDREKKPRGTILFSFNW